MISFKTFYLEDIRYFRFDDRLGKSFAESEVSPYEFLNRMQGKAITMCVNDQPQAVGGWFYLPIGTVVWMFASEDLLNKPILLFRAAKTWIEALESERPLVTYVPVEDTTGLRFAKRLGFKEEISKDGFVRFRH